MATINRKPETLRTHEGAVACRINPEQQLRRSVMACMLWENSFYEDGISIANRIADAVTKVAPEKVAAIAIEARESMKLRHVPLLLCRELARNGNLKAETLERVIQRADELTEFLAIYWADGRQPLAAQVKKGLAKAFPKFSAYQLAKYNRDKAVKLRDVLFLCHAKPKDKAQGETWKKLVDGTLESPDTWEVNLSGGEDKKTTWERLLQENKLGGLALLRNLRNMYQVQVESHLVFDALENMNVSRILPFRFIAAARYAPQWEPEIEKAMLRCLSEMPKFNGKTILLVDVSGSMDWQLNKRSDMNRIDVACGLGVCARELCDDVDIYTFSREIKRVPARRGFALRDAICNSQMHGYTYLGHALEHINTQEYDRLIVITDEQSHDNVAAPKGLGYIINVASYQNGVGYGRWLHMDGFSEAILKYIQEYERSF
jgi:hypothetical protein